MKNELKASKKYMRSIYGKNKTVHGEYDSHLAVKCHNGVFVGLENGNVISYKGIPFALPPVKNLRWKSPVSAPESDTVRQAYYFGNSPIQSELFSERGSLYKQSEDCLYLNIWVNQTNQNSSKPVMVFIHGGSYGWGATSDPLYEGTNFINKFDDIILVTIGYRTGIMGFLDLSSVEGGEEYYSSCNLGLLDQIEALKWVQKNISAFGGNPDNVTVFGESAGAGSVSVLPVMPLAKGLFKRVIAESGSVALTYGKDECQKLTKMLLEESKCRNMKELLSLSENEIKKINVKLNDFNNFPMRDGKIVPEHLYAAYESGVASRTDMIIGTNADECRYWIREVGGEAAYRFATPVMLENNRKKISPDDNELIDRFLNSIDDEEIWKITEFYNELLFRMPAISMAAHHSLYGGNCYVYYFNYPSAIPSMRACHAVELAYVFNNLTETIYTGDNIDKDLADKVQNLWVNFARNGNPSFEDVEWPKYDAVNRKTLFLGSKIRVEDDPFKERHELVGPLLKYKFNGCYSDLSFKTPHVRKTMTKVVGALLLALGITAAVIYGIIEIITSFF